MENTIRIQNLGIGHNGQLLFKPFSLEIPPGELTVMIGENGSGKSTLLHTIAGTLKPVSGSVKIGENVITNMSVKKRARLLSMTYTERAVSGGLTVKELVEMGRHPYTGFLGHLSKDDKGIIDRAMESVGISHKAESFLSDISDGERQKAMIARALAQQTPIMLFDEPTNFLDAASRLEILDLIHKLVKDKNITAILSGHDIASMLSIADNVITVLPQDENAVEISSTNDSKTAVRLNEIFKERGIIFDPVIKDFKIS